MLCKTLLLKSLAGEPGSVNKNLATVPTTGSNIVTIQRPNEGDLPPDTVNLREIGGGFLWNK